LKVTCTAWCPFAASAAIATKTADSPDIRKFTRLR
jgi:hypothetical protein